MHLFYCFDSKRNVINLFNREVFIVFRIDLVMKKRGQLVWQELAPWIIGVGVLVLVVILYLTLSEKGQGAIQFLKDSLRFRG